MYTMCVWWYGDNRLKSNKKLNKEICMCDDCYSILIV